MNKVQPKELEGESIYFIPVDIIHTHMMLLGKIRHMIATDLRYSHSNSNIRKINNQLVGDYNALEQAIERLNGIENAKETKREIAEKDALDSNSLATEKDDVGSNGD